MLFWTKLQIITLLSYRHFAGLRNFTPYMVAAVMLQLAVVYPKIPEELLTYLVGNELLQAVSNNLRLQFIRTTANGH